MRSLRSRPISGDRVATGLVALAAAVAVSGCGVLGSSESAEPGPPRLTPNPQPDAAAAMIDGISAPGDLLNACTLLDLTTAEIIGLTGADMPEVDPTGSGDLGMVCIYGGPGSPERAEAELSKTAAAESGTLAGPTTEPAAEPTTEPAAEPTAEVAPDATTTAATTTNTPVFDPEIVPDTFAAGVVKPRGGAGASLAEQATMLGVRYACSEIRGEDAATIEAAPGAPEAPAPVEPELPTAYIDCAAAPTGGGLEVHTILVADNDLWHLVLLGPETPRSPEAEAEALAGLHRVATEVLS